MERHLEEEPGNLRVAQHDARKAEDITGEEEVSEESPTILYGYTADRPSGVPHDFKVFARLGKQTSFMKGTLPEGPPWEHVWWRGAREHPSKDIIEPAPMYPNLVDECVRHLV